ncbi:MAG TPA: DUF362 domain-containing protein [Vicinamibacteria bacterium]|nr:DUF362 domain-containing protein [Vicinamibacteria bacterium]
MSERVDRRLVLRRLAGAGIVLGGSGGLAWLGLASRGRFQPAPPARAVRDHRVAEEASRPLLVVARGSDPTAMVTAALAGLGGMARFVKRGETVLVKPNMAWDRTPEQGANTHPDVVAEVVRQCRAAGAARVIVTDNPVHDAGRVAVRSGIASAASAAGAELLSAAGATFAPVAIGGVVLSSWDVLAAVLQADRLINVPVVKHHSLSRLTCGLKNHMGLLGGNRGRLHQEIHASVVDLAAAFRPTLTVVDATRVMLRNGPTGGRLDDLKAVNAVAAGTDAVACEAWAARQLGLDPFDVPSIVQAEGRGLGRVAAGVGPVTEVGAGA